MTGETLWTNGLSVGDRVRVVPDKSHPHRFSIHKVVRFAREDYPPNRNNRVVVFLEGKVCPVPLNACRKIKNKD